MDGGLACSGCGARLRLPTNLSAEEVACEFCATRTQLPTDLLALRLREYDQAQEAAKEAAVIAQATAATKKVSSLVLWIIIASVAFPLVLTFGILGFTAFMATRVTKSIPHQTHGH